MDDVWKIPDHPNQIVPMAVWEALKVNNFFCLWTPDYNMAHLGYLFEGEAYFIMDYNTLM